MTEKNSEEKPADMEMSAEPRRRITERKHFAAPGFPAFLPAMNYGVLVYHFCSVLCAAEDLINLATKRLREEAKHACKHVNM